jgi:hypothetical protein
VNALIYQKMANVYKEVEAIAKTRSNSGDIKYPFRGIDDVYNTLHKVFAKEGIFLVPETISSGVEPITSKSGSNGFHIISRIKFTFYAEDGSSVSAISEGEAIDYGDKATSKSQSMAIKYALLQTFMIPTEDTEDGDATTPEATKKSAVTPPVLKGEKPKGNQTEFLAKLGKSKTEAHIQAALKVQDAFMWTASEKAEHIAAINKLRKSWEATA